MYAALNRRSGAAVCDFSRAFVYAIDEFCNTTRRTPGTNSVYYREHLTFRPRAMHCPNPAATEPDVHIRAFADAIRRSGGFDLCALGIGLNGHIAFNEPGSTKDSRARVVELTDASRAAHAAAFGSLDAVPQQGITLGIADLLDSRAIVVLVTGAGKAAIVGRAHSERPHAGLPASWLHEHTNVTWLLDEEAASALPGRPA
jgi:glucosamine-6-phosphate deaminase